MLQSVQLKIAASQLISHLQKTAGFVIYDLW